MWPKNRPKMKNDVFFGFCEEFHTVNLILRKMVKIVKNRSKYPQKVVANGQANAHFLIGSVNTLTMHPGMVYKHFLLSYALIKLV